MKSIKNIRNNEDKVSQRWCLRAAILTGVVAVGLMVGGYNNQEPVSASNMSTTTLDIPSSSRERAPSHSEFSTNPTWEQDFSRMPDGPIDSNIWRFDLNPEVPGYNDEKQGYTNNTRNVRLENNKLVIEAHRESYSYPDDPEHHKFQITSGRIDTHESLNFEYGKIEATLKLPEGQGVWPAFWLLSANNPHTTKLQPTNNEWEQPRFYMHDGELDIMEFYGRYPDMIEATVHTFNSSPEGHVRVADATKTFHTYGIEITPDKIVWTADGTPYSEYKKTSDNPHDWPFGQKNEFYAILNLAMGGSGGGDIDSSQATWRMEVESLKFYEFTGHRPGN